MNRDSECSDWPAHGRRQRLQPQPPPGAQDELLDETVLLPLEIDANEEIFSSILALPQTGHTTSDTASALRTSFSNAVPHSEQSNS